MIRTDFARLETRPARLLHESFHVGRSVSSNCDLEDLEARESYEFLRPWKAGLGLGWTAIGPDEVVARLEQGREVLVRETRTVGGRQDWVEDSGRRGTSGPQIIARETVESLFTRPAELEAFMRVNSGLPPQDDTERLAQKIDALGFGTAEVGYCALKSGVSDLEAARRLQAGEPLTMATLALRLHVWTVVPRQVASVKLGSEAELDRLLEVRNADAAERVFQGPAVEAGPAGTIREIPGQVVIGDVELKVRR